MLGDLMTIVNCALFSNHSALFFLFGQIEHCGWKIERCGRHAVYIMAFRVTVFATNDLGNEDKGECDENKLWTTTILKHLEDQVSRTAVYMLCRKYS